ncbi:PhoD-like phosphatase-domain-containing protein [Auriculariales sp. MPI-PUGE-AT-0066]|nr:PhoD-like phosphatase-domain-containing protein [Auriculariales sp. MPI-PUGE-AT-0066]
MAWLEVVSTASTVLFRVLVYVYLRILPATKGKFILPPLFLISTAAHLLVQKQSVAAQSEIAPPVDVKLETTETETVERNVEVNKIVDVVVVPAKDVKAPAQPEQSALKSGLRSIFETIVGSNVQKPGLNVLGNVLLFVAAVDFTVHPFIYEYDDVVFTRVGALTHNSAKVQARYPGLEDGAARILYRSAVSAGAWKDGPLLIFDNSTDYVAAAKITSLYPSTQYEYVLAYPNATILPYPASPIPFRTFPDTQLTSGSGTHFKFLVSSCAMPNFPYLPFHGTRVKGFDLLADYLWPQAFNAPLPQTSTDEPEPVIAEQVQDILPETTQTITEPASATPEAEFSTSTTATDTIEPTSTIETGSFTAARGAATQTPGSSVPTEFMLFLGDFIYADVPWGSQTLDHYRRLYRRMFASPSLRKVYERLPIFTIYDDHEIVNNFAGNNNETKEPWVNASTAYHNYLGSVNYDSRRGHTHYEFRYGDNAFFVMDTRKYRSDDSVEEAERTMLGEQQLVAFHNWLSRVNGTAVWKFVVSSVPLTELWGYDAQKDSWAAYEDERQSIISALTSVQNIVVLTGDRHQFAAVDYMNGRLLEVSTSPMSQFDLAVNGFPALRRWASEKTFSKTVTAVNATDGTTYQTAVEYPVERVLEYVPKGNYKVSSIEVDTRDQNAPKLVIELIVDGKSVWHLKAKGQPVRLSATQALGRQLSQGLKDILGLVKLRPSSWF